MKQSKLIFLAVFLIVAIAFALFEFGVLPLAAIVNTPEMAYVINLASIVTAVGGCFILLYWFRFPMLRHKIEHSDERYADAVYGKASSARLWTWMTLMLINIVLYYEAPFADNPKYGILILFVAGIFCWPTRR